MPIRPWMRSDGVREIFSAFFAALGPDSIRFVGGCVRDGLLGLPVGDVDLAARCPPDKLTQILAGANIRAFPVGLDHGVVQAIVDAERYEIASLRKDIVTDGRYAQIACTDDWTEDARRRDFRCNALYANWDGRLFDPTGGLEDILVRKVIFVGEPDQRIREDYLRILRFFRFSARYAKTVDGEGLSACARLRTGLSRISAERIWAEVKALLGASSPGSAVRAMQESGVLSQLFPSHVGADRLLVMERIDAETDLDPDSLLRLVALMPLDADHAALALSLRMSSLETKAMIAAAGPLDADISDTLALARLAYRIGEKAVQGRIRLHWATTDEAHPDTSVLEKIASWQPPRFPAGGQDAIDAGLTGAGIGAALRILEEEWIALDFLPSRDCLLRRLRIIAQSIRNASSSP